MTFIVADRVQETTNSPGTGTATLLGAVSGYQSFSTGIGANNTTFYVIADQLGTNWEVGLGALNSTGTVLTRTTVYSSSNGGSTVNFATGTQYVWCDFPASKSVLQGAAVNFSSIGATTAGTGAFTTLSASSTVSGAGFSNYFAAPPTIGNTTPNAGTFTTLVATSITDSGLTAGRVNYNGVGGLLQDSANMTFNGTTLTLANDASISGLTVGKGGGAVASNTVFGVNALVTNSAGTDNSAFGINALNKNTGSYNSAFGVSSLYANTTGTFNTGYGWNSLPSNTTGSYNVGVGPYALNSNTTASNNTAVGYQAGYSNSVGQYSTFVGTKAGYTATGDHNTCIGMYSGYSLTTGTANTFVGQFSGSGAGGLITTGSKNTIIGGYSGNQGGLDIRTASNYIVLSDGDGNPYFFMNQGVYTGATLKAVGNDQQLTLTSTAGAYSSRINLLSAGGGGSVLFGTTSVAVQSNTQGVILNTNATAWSANSDERIKDIIEPISDATNKVSSLRAVIGKYKTDQDGIRRSFLIAQDVQAVLPEAVVAQQDEIGTLSLAYTDVIPLLVAAINELNAKVTALEAGAK